MVDKLQFAPEVGAGDFAAEKAAILGDHAFDFSRCFIHEFDAKMACTDGAKSLEIFGASLGHGIEDSIAATSVGLERMLRADAVLELDIVGIAGAATISIVGAFGEERAENAVLHVEHGHVLVQGDFEPVRGSAAKKCFDLFGVEIVGNGEALELVFILEIFGGQ